MRHGFNKAAFSGGHANRAGRKLAAIAAMAQGFAAIGEARDIFGASFGGEGPFGADFGFGGGRGGRFGGGGGGGGPRGGGRGRGRRGMFGREELRLLLLSLIAEEPRHGYDLIKVLEERSGGHYAPSPGVIYPSLALLADEGLIAEQPGTDQRRRFALTPDGGRLLTDEQAQVVDLRERLGKLATSAEQDRKPQIERAAMNLGMAMRQRLQTGGADELPHEIAAILDEAARKIERL